ncbi:MAG: VCBS repeat-containing protein [Planctomycetes bacterium]|nr:VCBS repeat-containing protein [Planctomycetota bacterium]
MSPQFVDFDHDGHLDIVAGTFSGSPYRALGNGSGFAQPEMILDRDGERIVLNQFWNYDSKKWDETDRCDPVGGAPAMGHGTSAWAMDWDRDGDLDLLLGDYHSGYLYLRCNEGTAVAPAFAKQNVLVEAGGQPIQVGKTATMRLVDYDGDGRQDLLLGSMGDSYGDGEGGGVFVYPAIAGDATRFGARITLIEPSRKGHTEVTRPDAGLYIDMADCDGDGDLDLIVGGYSMWTQVGHELSAAEKARVAELEAAIAVVDAETQTLGDALNKATDGIENEEEVNRIFKKVFAEQQEQRQKLSQQRRPLHEELRTLVPGKERKTYVWLYENVTAAAGGAGGSEPGGQ